jgi:hypothetical protein
LRELGRGLMPRSEGRPLPPDQEPLP